MILTKSIIHNVSQKFGHILPIFLVVVEMNGKSFNVDRNEIPVVPRIGWCKSKAGGRFD